MTTATATDVAPRIRDRRSSRFEVDREELLEALKTVRKSISPEETRVYLHGIYFHARRDGVFLVATNGHHLTKWRLETAHSLPLDVGVIVGKESVQALIKALSLCHEYRVAITLEKWQEFGLGYGGQTWVDKATAKAQCGEQTFACETVDGVFPDYERVVGRPKRDRYEKPIGCRIEAKPLRKAIAEIFKTAGRRHVTLGFAWKSINGTLRLSGHWGEPIIETRKREIQSGKRKGQTVEERHVVCYERRSVNHFMPCEVNGQAIEVGFNGRYFRDLIGQKGKWVELWFCGNIGGPWRIVVDGNPAEITLMPCKI